MLNLTPYDLNPQLLNIVVEHVPKKEDPGKKYQERTNTSKKREKGGEGECGYAFTPCLNPVDPMARTHRRQW